MFHKLRSLQHFSWLKPKKGISWNLKYDVIEIIVYREEINRNVLYMASNEMTFSELQTKNSFKDL